MLSYEAIETLFKSSEENPQIKNTHCLLKNQIFDKTIERIYDVPYKIFFRKYLLDNKPCILSSEITQNWKCKREWITPSGKPNLIFLQREFGSSVVPVADCNMREYNSQLKQNMFFKDYIDYWQKLEEANDKNLPCLYMKDWHFNRAYPEYHAYETPEYFSSDWLNEFCANEADDYQFVYMGPKGTWTPLHADVFGSYSWSVNICGRKRWMLFPPGNEIFLEGQAKHVPYVIDESNLMQQNISYIDVIQEAGEIIFVPSGWYHQVWNLEDTISVNHNWFNGCNIEHIWHCLHNAAHEVEKELLDCKGYDEWEDQCQIILKLHHGMNYADFLQILEHTFKTRLKAYENRQPDDWHCIFDVISIRNVLFKMIKMELPQKVMEESKNLRQRIVNFLSDINDVHIVK